MNSLLRGSLSFGRAVLIQEGKSQQAVQQAVVGVVAQQAAGFLLGILGAFVLKQELDAAERLVRIHSRVRLRRR